MSSNGTEDSIICLDDSESLDNSASNCNVTSENAADSDINIDKTLQPDGAPDVFIVLDELVDPINDETSEKGDESKENIDDTLIKVIFQNEAVACKYREKIRDFLKNLLSANLTDESSNCSDLVLEIKSSDVKQNKNSQDSSNIADQSLFTIDSTPGRHDTYNVPTYGKKFARVLTETYDEPPDENNDKAPPKLNCFNCLGNHTIRDCPQPKNQIEINKNRKEFMAKSGPRNVRYHIDDQRFTPGKLSMELRRALGLGQNDLPNHIHKMRLLGYPPGWLEEAKLHHSGLNLYNSDGLREADPKEEIGEIFCPESATEFDITKIYDFPGFNVPPPAGTRDAYWNADQQAMHSKEAMLQMLNHQKAQEGYKRRKLKPTNGPSADAITEPVQMEIDALEVTPVESVSINGHFSSTESPKSPGELTDDESSEPDCGSLDITLPLPKVCVNNSETLNSPSLAELEARKKLLLAELNDTNSSSNPGTPIKSTNNSASEISTPAAGTPTPAAETPTPVIETFTPIADTSTPIAKTSTPIAKTSTPIAETPSTSSNRSNNENTPKVGAVKSVEMGTPIIESASVYTKLPSSDKFAKDICDVINFENLPGATGKFEQMSGLLQKIRTTLTSQKD